MQDSMPLDRGHELTTVRASKTNADGKPVIPAPSPPNQIAVLAIARGLSAQAWKSIIDCPRTQKSRH